MTDTLPGTISTVHRYDLPLSPREVWEQIARWTTTAAGGPGSAASTLGLGVGEEWRCEVQPPLPYIVRFQVAIEKVEAPVLVHALVLGDVVGDATLELEEAESGCRATLTSALAPGNAALRLVSRFAAPLARFGHDWVLDSGARQFIAHVAPPRPGG